MNDKLHVRARSTAEAPYSLVVSPESAGWRYSGLRMLELAAGQAHTFSTGEEEMLVLPLRGAATVSCDGERFALAGRRSFFSRITDLVYEVGDPGKDAA